MLGAYASVSAIAIMAAAPVTGPTFNQIVAELALAMWDPTDTTSLFTTGTGETQVAADGDPVGLMLDVRPAYAAGFANAAAWIATLDNLRGGGVPFKVGTTTDSTYNPATGEGVTYRTDGLNYGGVRIPGLSLNVLYRVDLENLGSSNKTVRNNGIVMTVLPGQRRTCFLRPSSLGTIDIQDSTVNPSNGPFKLWTIQAVPGLHRSQDISGRRPAYKISGALSSVLYDGLDDCLPTVVAVNLTGTDKLTYSTGVRNLSNVNDALFVEQPLGSNGFYLGISSANNTFRAGCGSPDSVARMAVSASTPPQSAVLTSLYDKAQNSATTANRVRLNGVEQVLSALTAGNPAGNFANGVIYFGSRNNGASNASNLYEYGTILHSGIADDATLANYELWNNQRSGAY